jgi:hypothetical protein
MQSKMAVSHIKLETRVAERRKRMHENTEEVVKEKLQRVNEPGVVVKCLFDPTTMDDIEYIAENLPENLRNDGHIYTNRRFNHNSWHSDK